MRGCTAFRCFSKVVNNHVSYYGDNIMLCDHRVIDHLLVWLLRPEPIAAEQLLAYISYCFLLSIVVIWLLKTQSVVLCFC